MARLVVYGMLIVLTLVTIAVIDDLKFHTKQLQRIEERAAQCEKKALKNEKKALKNEKEIKRISDLFKKTVNVDPAWKPHYSVEITASAYTARAKECDATPEVTAFGSPTRVGIVAISRDLQSELGLSKGHPVFINGLGVFIVDDKMGPDKYAWDPVARKRLKTRVPITRSIDILHANPKAAWKFGTKKVTMTWVPVSV